MTIKTELRDSLIVAKKEFKILSRKKALIIPLVLFPIIMIVFFGYGMGWNSQKRSHPHSQ